jgi:hypothetical protein
VANNDGRGRVRSANKVAHSLSLRFLELFPRISCEAEAAAADFTVGQTKPEYGRVPEFCSTRRAMQRSRVLAACWFPGWRVRWGRRGN